MKARHLLLLALLPTALRAAEPSAAVNGTDPLFFVRAQAVDEKGAPCFYSFLPPEGPSGGRPLVLDLVRRLDAWKCCVAKLVGIDDAKSVRPMVWTNSFRIRVREDDFGTFLVPGVLGISVVALHGQAGGGSWTNGLEIADDAVERRSVARPVPPPDASCALFPGRGAGGDLWFVTAADLETRWEERESRDVAAELNNLAKAWRAGTPQRDWLEDWRGAHPEIWPSLQFDNQAERRVLLSFKEPLARALGTEGFLLSGKTLTNLFFRSLPNEEDLADNWTYLEDGSQEEDLQPMKTAIPWTVDRTEPVRIELHSRKRRAGSPTINLRSFLPYGFDLDKADPGQFEVSVRYDARTELCWPDPSDPWRRVVEPHRTITGVAIHTNGIFEGRSFVPERNEYPYGDASVVPNETVTLAYRPWPGFVLSNPLNDRPVTIVLSFGDVWADTNQLEEGEADRFVAGPPKTIAPNESSLDIRAVTTAKKAAFVPGKPLRLVRGGPNLDWRPDPQADKVRGLFETEHPAKGDLRQVGELLEEAWVSKRAKMSGSLAHKRADIGKMVQNALEREGRGAKKPVIRLLREHIGECRGKCKDCLAFAEQLSAAGIGCASGAVPSPRQAALACARLYHGEKTGADEAALDRWIQVLVDELGKELDKATIAPERETAP